MMMMMVVMMAMVVPKSLTTFVLKDLPPGQTILPILSTDTMLHPSFSPARKAAQVLAR